MAGTMAYLGRSAERALDFWGFANLAKTRTYDVQDFAWWTNFMDQLGIAQALLVGTA
jgi:hypothetical protein